MNSTGKEIVAKVAVFVTVSSSVFVLSAASAAASLSRVDIHDQNAHLMIDGDQTHWVVGAECLGDHFFGHIDTILPNKKKITSGPDSNHPQTLNMSGAGAGQVFTRCYNMTMPGHYEPAGAPSKDVD